jgi:hypothetical protein
LSLSSYDCDDGEKERTLSRRPEFIPKPELSSKESVQSLRDLEPPLENMAILRSKHRSAERSVETSQPPGLWDDLLQR